MLVPFPNDPVRKNRRIEKVSFSVASIVARWELALLCSVAVGVSLVTKSRKPSSIVRGMWRSHLVFVRLGGRGLRGDSMDASRCTDDLQYHHGARQNVKY